MLWFDHWVYWENSVSSSIDFQLHGCTLVLVCLSHSAALYKISRNSAQQSMRLLMTLGYFHVSYMFAHNTGRLLVCLFILALSPRLLTRVHITMKWGQGSLAKKHISPFLRPPSFSVLPGAYFDSCIQLSFRVLPVCSHLLCVTIWGLEACNATWASESLFPPRVVTNCRLISSKQFLFDEN